jgi:hypothetical protein
MPAINAMTRNVTTQLNMMTTSVCDLDHQLASGIDGSGAEAGQ